MAGMTSIEIGVQTYTYRNFSLADTVRQLKGTGITAVELFSSHLNRDMPAKKVAEAKRMLADAGVRVCGYGVSYLSPNPDSIEPTLEFVRDLGAEYLGIDIDRGDIKTQERAVAAAEEVGVLLAIHNHGPGANYSTIDDVLSVVEKYPVIMGACVDTGHFLRSSEDPVDAIKRLGKRVHAVHLKDYIDENTEVVPGTGKLDYGKAVAALKKYTDFHSAFVIEYEANPDDPTPAMKETVGVLKKSLAD